MARGVGHRSVGRVRATARVTIQTSPGGRSNRVEVQICAARPATVGAAPTARRPGGRSARAAGPGAAKSSSPSRHQDVTPAPLRAAPPQKRKPSENPRTSRESTGVNAMPCSRIQRWCRARCVSPQARKTAPVTVISPPMPTPTRP